MKALSSVKFVKLHPLKMYVYIQYNRSMYNKVCVLLE